MNKSTALTKILVFLVCSYTHSLKAQDDYASGIAAIGPEAFAVLRQFYDYDKAVPLDVNIDERINRNNYVREKIIFRGQHSQVSGYLAIPKNGNSPYPTVLLLHGVTSSKESWWEEHSTMGQLTEQLLASGHAVLTLDAEYHGERAKNNPFKSPIIFLEKGWFVHIRDMMIQSLIDYRRGLDYLETRDEIDMSRIGMIGYSMGGIMTFMLSSVDVRINVAVSCVSPIVTVPYLPTGVQSFAPFTREIAFLMLMAKSDERNYTAESAEQIHNMLSGNRKELVFFDSGHMLPKEWTRHAIEWMERYLE